MQQEGIPATLIGDNMAGFLMQKGEIDLVIVGADRIAANGDVANKIGTYSLAVLAQAHKIPFYVAAPLSTFDLKIDSESYSGESAVHGTDALCRCANCPSGIKCYNPAFDVTPAALITAIITEQELSKSLRRNINKFFAEREMSEIKRELSNFNRCVTRSVLVLEIFPPIRMIFGSRLGIVISY